MNLKTYATAQVGSVFNDTENNTKQITEIKIFLSYQVITNINTMCKIHRFTILNIQKITLVI